MRTLTPAQRSTAARLAAYARASQYGPEVTRPAFEGRMAKLAATVDPEGTLPEIERQRRSYALLRSQMAALSLKASRKRSKRKAAPVIVSPGAATEARRDDAERPPAA